MQKKILILSGSSRKDGNTDKLCIQFEKGALDKGHLVEKVLLNEKKIEFCDACYECQQNGGICHIKDDVPELVSKLMEVDVIVLASPVYFYSISGRLKAFLDRCFMKWKNIENKEFYYIITSAQDHKQTIACTLGSLRGFAVCMGNSKEKGVLCAQGFDPERTIENTEYMQKAYDLGYSISLE